MCYFPFPVPKFRESWEFREPSQFKIPLSSHSGTTLNSFSGLAEYLLIWELNKLSKNTCDNLITRIKENIVPNLCSQPEHGQCKRQLLM